MIAYEITRNTLVVAIAIGFKPKSNLENSHLKLGFQLKVNHDDGGYNNLKVYLNSNNPIGEIDIVSDNNIQHQLNFFPLISQYPITILRNENDLLEFISDLTVKTINLLGEL